MHQNWNRLKYNFIRLLAVVIIAGMIFLILSCNNSTSSREKTGDSKATKEKLLKINKKMVKTEDQKIADFMDRYHWQMNKTASGLRYNIYHDGRGKQAEKGMKAKFSFTLNLLTGDTIYSSAEQGPKEIVLGKGGVESGLEEGILLLNEGDRAKFIIPSHLAYGLVGDMKKIPTKATLVYDIELLELKQ